MKTKLFIYTLCLLGALFSLPSCKKEEKAKEEPLKVASNGWSPGDCIDKALSPYVYQIADIDGGTLFLYPMGKMGKDIVKKSLEELKRGSEPFKKVPCP